MDILRTEDAKSQQWTTVKCTTHKLYWKHNTLTELNFWRNRCATNVSLKSKWLQKEGHFFYKLSNITFNSVAVNKTQGQCIKIICEYDTKTLDICLRSRNITACSAEASCCGHMNTGSWNLLLDTWTILYGINVGNRYRQVGWERHVSTHEDIFILINISYLLGYIYSNMSYLLFY